MALLHQPRWEAGVTGDLYSAAPPKSFALIPLPPHAVLQCDYLRPSAQTATCGFQGEELPKVV